jgi:Ca2+-binding RTX toxin-like protein
VVPFFISLDRASDAPVSVDFVTGDEDAERGSDYHGRQGTVTIPAGERFVTLFVTTILDRQFETDEQLRLELSNPTGATLDQHIDKAIITNSLRTGRCANDVIGRGRSDTLSGTAAGDRMRGRVGEDVLFGLSGDDCIYGERGHDILFGGDGNDVLEGDAGNDQIKGDAGNDRLVGGRGINRYSGGAGNDKIYARNGHSEIVECGPGRDWVKADRTDRLRRCERVTRAGG